MTSESATAGTVSAIYTWSSPQLTADVQSWVTNAANTFGWTLIGD